MISLLDNKEVRDLGAAYYDINYLRGKAFSEKVLALLNDFSKNTFNYTFKNPKFLLEAVTHKSARDFYGLDSCYEKLEVLGDCILDYLMNYNLIHYTLFERYLKKDSNVY